MTAATDRWATFPGPRKLLDAARALLQERRSGNGVTVRADLTAAERAQAARLLGLDWDVSGRAVTLGRLRAALSRAGDDLDALLTRTGGPVVDVRARREADAAAQAARLDTAYATLTGAGVPAHAVALARSRRWLDRGGRDLACDLARLWHALPGSGRPLAELATTLFADPHRLDRDGDLGRVAARLLAAVTAGAGDAAAAAGAADTALTATRWRQVWATHGVVCDEVSATVLVLNLPLTGRAAAAALSTATPGEPVWLTARSLAGDWTPAVDAVRICENPAIVEAAADRLGPAGHPLVCVYGRPSSAAWTLLRRLATSGVPLLATTDRDDAGRQILAELLALPGAAEWLPDAPGTYEESRLDALIADLTPG